MHSTRLDSVWNANPQHIHNSYTLSISYHTHQYIYDMGGTAFNTLAISFGAI